MTMPKYDRNKIYKDASYLEYLIESSPFNERTKAHISHYAVDAAKRCRLMKRSYYFFNTVIIICPFFAAMIDLLSTQTLTFLDYFSYFLSSLASVSAGLLSLFRCHDSWTRYRPYLEQIISTVIEYSEKEDADSADNQRKLLEKLNTINKDHQNAWQRERESDKNG